MEGITLNGNGINLPKSVTRKFRDKFKIRHTVKREPLLFHIMLKQGLTCFNFASNNPQEAVEDIPDILPEKNGLQSGTILQLSHQILFMHSTRGHNRCRYHSTYTEEYPYLWERPKYTSIQMQSMGYGNQTVSFPKKENEGLYQRTPNHC